MSPLQYTSRSLVNAQGALRTKKRPDGGHHGRCCGRLCGVGAVVLPMRVGSEEPRLVPAGALCLSSAKVTRVVLVERHVLYLPLSTVVLRGFPLHPLDPRHGPGRLLGGQWLPHRA